MSKTQIQTVVHALAIVTGVLGIMAASAPQLGLPSYAVAVVGVAITVLTYVANQVPALGDSGSPAERSAAPVAPAPPAAPVAEPAAAPGPSAGAGA